MAAASRPGCFAHVDELWIMQQWIWRECQFSILVLDRTTFLFIVNKIDTIETGLTMHNMATAQSLRVQMDYFQFRMCMFFTFTIPSSEPLLQEKQDDVYWVLQTVLRTTDRASEEGKLFTFVPDFYVDVCINSINALTGYFHPTVPYTSLPGKLHIYHQQTKLREGHVFTRDCLFMGGGWGGDASHTSLLTFDGHCRRHVKVVYLSTCPHQYWYLVVATETRTVGKRAVRFLLEYCFVTGSFRVRLFIDFGCPEDLGTWPWHFYDN